MQVIRVKKHVRQNVQYIDRRCSQYSIQQCHEQRQMDTASTQQQPF